MMLSQQPVERPSIYTASFCGPGDVSVVSREEPKDILSLETLDGYLLGLFEGKVKFNPFFRAGSSTCGSRQPDADSGSLFQSR